MIGKGKCITHTSAAISYAMEKNGAEIIDKKMVIGENGKEISNEFKLFQDLNKRTENNTISFVLSPEPKQGETLNNNQMKILSDDFLKRMGLENNQAVIVKHTDKAHTHLHIFVNRINEKGEAYKDNFIGKKSQNTADQVAKERGLIRAKEVMKSKELSTQQIRKEIKEISDKVIKSKPKNFLDYSKKMETLGVKINPKINKNGQMQGFRVDFKGMNFKASEVHKTMSFGNIEKQIAQIGRILTKGFTLGL